MLVTAADVRNVVFSKPPLGKRGYHEDEVDAFLDVVGAELARLITENNTLRDRIEQRQRAAPDNTGLTLRPPQPPGPAITPIPPPRTQQTSPGDHHVHAATVLGLAQEIADRLTREAKADADAMLNEARTISEQLLCQARAKADGMVTEATTRAETLLTAARTRADTLDRQSREKAASLQRDAARQHTEIIGSISQEKTILEKKIDELRTFEREYRTHWKTCLQTQLRELDGHRSVTPQTRCAPRRTWRLPDPVRAPKPEVDAPVGSRRRLRCLVDLATGVYATGDDRVGWNSHIHGDVFGPY